MAVASDAIVLRASAALYAPEPPPPDRGGGAGAGETIEGPIIRPQPGLFVTFPAHAYHRTHLYATAPGDAAPCIVVAFNLEPRAHG